MKCFTSHLLETFFGEGNTSWVEEHNQLWKEQRRFDISAKFILSIFIKTTNGLMIFGILKTNKKLNLVKKLFLYSAICGTLTGLTIPYYASANILFNVCFHEAIGEIVLSFLFFTDFLNLLTIGVIRFKTLRYPLKRIRTCTVFVWLAVEFIAAVCLSVAYYITYTSGTSSLHKTYWICNGIFTVICICLSTLLITKLRCTLHKSLLSTDPNYLKKRQKAVNRLFWIAFVYIIFTTPMTLAFLYVGINFLQIPSSAIQFSHELVFFSWCYNIFIGYSGFNSLIYICFDEKIKNYYFHLFCGRKRASHSLDKISMQFICSQKSVQPCKWKKSL